MKKIAVAVITSVLAVLCFGCGSHTVDKPTQAAGQSFNAVQYYQDFSSATPDLKTLADNAWKCVQAGAFASALKNLGQLDANPTLNAAQKKSVADLTEQVKKQMAEQAPAK